MIRTAAVLFRKDVLVEVRTLQSFTAMVLFSVMAFVLKGKIRSQLGGGPAAVYSRN